MPRRNAFTILELLVTVSIIVLLIGLVFVALRGVRTSASRTETLNSLRSMAQGYVAYSTENKGYLMPGYVAEYNGTQMLDYLEIKVRVENGQFADNCTGNGPYAGSCDASSYVLRLAPYLNHQWKALYTDYGDQTLISRIEAEMVPPDPNDQPIYGPGSANPAQGEIGVACVPAYGLNSIYLGGDTTHGNADTRDRNPWLPVNTREVRAATRMSDVRRPARIVVFAPCLQVNGAYIPTNTGVADVEWGFMELRPPWTYFESDGELTTADRQWRLEGSGGDLVVLPGNNRTTNGMGVPVARVGLVNEIPAAHLDGSVEIIDRKALSLDMTYWAPNYPSGAGSN